MADISRRTKVERVNRVHGNGKAIAKRSNSSRLVGLLGFVTMALAVLVIGSSVVLCIANAMKPADDLDCEVMEVTVMPGDTLWGIAKDCFGPEVDLRVAVDDIMRENNLSNSVVRPGQVLRVVMPIDVPSSNRMPDNLRRHELANAGAYIQRPGK
jgi:hypothetical protein